MTLLFKGTYLCTLITHDLLIQFSIGGRNITDLRFADDIDALAEEEQELEALVESFDKTLEQLFQMMAPNQRFSQGLHKPLQLLQS